MAGGRRRARARLGIGRNGVPITPTAPSSARRVAPGNNAAAPGNAASQVARAFTETSIQETPLPPNVRIVFALRNSDTDPQEITTVRTAKLLLISQTFTRVAGSLPCDNDTLIWRLHDNEVDLEMAKFFIKWAKRINLPVGNARAVPIRGATIANFMAMYKTLSFLQLSDSFHFRNYRFRISEYLSTPRLAADDYLLVWRATSPGDRLHDVTVVHKAVESITDVDRYGQLGQAFGVDAALQQAYAARYAEWQSWLQREQRRAQHN